MAASCRCLTVGSLILALDAGCRRNDLDVREFQAALAEELSERP